MRPVARDQFKGFIDDFLPEFFAFHPETATAWGVHAHDDQLTDFSERGIARDATRLKRALSRLKQIPLEEPHRRNGISPQLRCDLLLTRSTLEAALFDVEEMRPWQRDPASYNEIINFSLFALMKRNFAPLQRRVRSIIEREKQIPDALQEAGKNLRRVPTMLTQLSIEQFESTLQFLQTSLPAAVSTVRDPKLLAAFEDSNAKAIQAYLQFIDFLKKRILPRGTSRIGIGEKRYRKKLWLEEMVDLPLDQLLSASYRWLEEHHEMFRRVAAQIDPHLSPEEILEQMTQDHPRGEEVLSRTSAALDQLRRFLVERDIISIPDGSSQDGACTPCHVDESPELLRNLTFASLDVPGPLETKSRDYYYYVTLPDPRWNPEQREQHLRFFSQHLILTTSIHEAFPGHFVHFLWVHHHPSKVRRLFGAGSHVEGWAHYCEQMMIEAGFGNGDQRLHLAQLHEAMLRICRFIVGIEMHVGDMSFRRARNFFVREAHMQPLNAEREAKRGLIDPTYLVYTLGKMQFLRLREDLKQKLGSQFSLKRFHNACVQNGFPPLPLLRELLIGERRAVI